MALFGGFRGSIPTAPKVIEETEVQTPQGQVQSTEVLQSREPSLGGQSDVALSLSRKTEDLERSSPEQATLDPNKPFAGFSTMGTVPGVTSSTIDQGPVPTGLGKPLEAAAEGTTHIPATETIKRAGQFKEDISINQETGLSKKNLKTLQDFVGKQDMPQEMKSKFFNALIPGVLEKLSNTEGTPEFKARQQQEFETSQAEREESFSRFNPFEWVGIEGSIPTIPTIDLKDEVKAHADAIDDTSFGAILDPLVTGSELGGKTIINAAAGFSNIAIEFVNGLGKAGSTANVALTIAEGARDWGMGKDTPAAEVVKAFAGGLEEDILQPIETLLTKGDPKPLVELMTENPALIAEAFLGPAGVTAGITKGLAKTAKAIPGKIKGIPKAVHAIPDNIQALRKTMSGLEDIDANAAKNITRKDFDELSKAAKARAAGDDTLSALETTAKNVEEAVNTAVTTPKNKLGKDIGKIRSKSKALGKDLSVDPSDAQKKLDSVLEDTYNTKITTRTTPDGKKITDVSPGRQGGIEGLEGEELNIMTQLQKELQTIKSVADIDTVFKKANKVYEKYITSNQISSDKVFVRSMGEVREVLEKQLDGILGSEYKELRQEWGRLAELETRMKPLFSKKIPGQPGREATTTRSLKKIFSPDRSQLEDLAELKEITGIDFIAQTRVSKFLDEAAGNTAAKSLLEIETPKVSGVIDTSLFVAKRVLEKAAGGKENVARRLTKDFDTLSKAKKVEVMNVADEVIKNADDTAEVGRILKKFEEDTGNIISGLEKQRATGKAVEGLTSGKKPSQILGEQDISLKKQTNKGADIVDDIRKKSKASNETSNLDIFEDEIVSPLSVDPRINRNAFESLVEKAKSDTSFKIRESDVEAILKSKPKILERGKIMDELMPEIEGFIEEIAPRDIVKSKATTPKIPQKDIAKELGTEGGVLNNLNPTGGLHVEYNPRARATAKLGPNMTTLDKTMEVSPDTLITIYRGAPTSQRSIVPGDFVTPNKELARAYGADNIIEMRVKARDVLDDITEPLGEEYIYRPQ